jgi:CRISPR/Cas system-associated protein endoribonuclease Cas2
MGLSQFNQAVIQNTSQLIQHSVFCAVIANGEHAAPRTLSVRDIMWAALSEAEYEIRMMCMVEKSFGRMKVRCSLVTCPIHS